MWATSVKVAPSLRPERKAMYLPSGLQRGCVEDSSAEVSATASAPAVPEALMGTIQMRSLFESSLSLGVETV